MTSSIKSKKELFFNWNLGGLCVYTHMQTILYLKCWQVLFKLEKIKWHYNNILKHMEDDAYRKYFFYGKDFEGLMERWGNAV